VLVQKLPAFYQKSANYQKQPPPKKRYRPQKKRQLVLFKPKKAPQTSKNSQFGALAPTLVTLTILNCLLMENKGQIKE